MKYLSKLIPGCKRLKRSLPANLSILFLFAIFTGRALPASRQGAGTADNLSGLPPAVVPFGVGVNIHFVTGHIRELDMIEAAGFKFIRMDFHWARTEKIKGVYDWSAYDELTSNLKRRGIRAIYILDYNNPLYTGKRAAWGPRSSADVAAYSNWAAAAAKHFKGDHIVWEIWNEPNNRAFWKPHPDVRQYITLALSACKAIRKADPGAVIIGPAAVKFNWKFFTSFFKSGVLQYLNGVSVHPYRGSRPPETVGPDFRRLRRIIDRYEPEGKNIPIVSSEWGYTTYTRGVSYRTQADYVVRQQLFNLYCGVPVSIWYDWKNNRPDLAVKGDNRGVVTYTLKPKPSYFAVQTLTHELSGYHIIKRYNTGDASDVVLVLSNAERLIKLAAWTTGRPHNVSIPLSLFSLPNPTDSVRCIGEEGSAGSAAVKSNLINYKLTGAPEYFIP